MRGMRSSSSYYFFSRGSLVEIEESTKSRSRFDIARVLIRTVLLDLCNRNARVIVNEVI
jgi:hypothetical protein